MKTERATACLLGGALGDSLGLPFEGVSPRRIARWLRRRPFGQRFVFGRGMLSDDTDHAVFTAQALLRAQGNVDRFRRALAWRMRLWLLTLPAGIGLATLRSLILLWCGVPPTRSGVWSAGNGPLMRAPLIGCVYADDSTRRRAFVDASTRMTHRDPQVLTAARALADVAAAIARGEFARAAGWPALQPLLRAAGDETEWKAMLLRLGDCFTSRDPCTAARVAFGGAGGISGYALHTLPFALAAWHTYRGDVPATLEAVIRAGGDTDTVGAIAGSLAALSAPDLGAGSAWIDAIADWPHSPRYLRQLGVALDGAPAPVATGFCAGLWLRSPLFMALVLAHGLRRLAPPY